MCICQAKFWMNDVNDTDKLSLNIYYLLVFSFFLFHGFPAFGLVLNIFVLYIFVVIQKK